MTSTSSSPGNPPPASVTGRPVLAREAVLFTERNRAWGFALLVSVVALIEAVAIVVMVPLKQSVPYFLEVDRLTGEVRPSGQVAERFEPGEVTLRYFMGLWAKRRLALDPEVRIAEREIALAYAMTSGAATTQMDNWLNQDKPFEKLRLQPGFSREVELMPASFLSKEVAVIDATVTEQLSGHVMGRRRVRLTLHFTLVPLSAADSDEALKRALRINPIGFYVTHYSLDDLK